MGKFLLLPQINGISAASGLSRLWFAIKNPVYVFLPWFFFLNIHKAEAQYCTPSFSFNACVFGNDFWITSVQLGTLSGAETGCIAAGSALRSQTGTVTAGSTYTISVNRQGNTYQCTMQAWADWDNNGVFNNNANEYILNQTNNAGGSNNYSASVTVPAGANVGTCRIRVMVNYLGGGGTNGCTPGAQSQGEFLDYNITVAAGTPCSGTPASLPVSPTTPTICSNATQVLTVTPDASGYTYQWQESNASGGTYTNVTGGSGGTTATFTTPSGSALPFSPTYYRCNVTCAASGQTTASQVSTVSLSSFINCYCTSGPFYSNAHTTARLLRNVTLAGNITTINQSNSTVLSAPYRRSYTTPVAELTNGSTYTLSTRVGTATTASHSVAAWIDYDQDGQFGGYNSSGAVSVNDHYNASGTLERIMNYNLQVGAAAPGALYNNNFTIPAGAISGTTAMRVRYRFGASMAAVGACQSVGTSATNGGAGEIQDYRVTIVAGCFAPTTQASAFVTDPSPTTTSCNVQFTRGNGTGGILVLTKAGSAPTPPVSGTDYLNPNQDITTGGISTTGAGSYVVYNSNVVASGSPGSQFTVPVSGLTPGTTYYFAAYEYDGNCYNLVSAPNGTCVIPLCIQPTTQVSGVTVPTISTTDATLNWTAGNGNKTLIILRQGAAPSGSPALTTTYTDNLNFNFGSPSGSSLASGNVMFGDGGADNATAATITGLLPSTTYYYAIYSYFSSTHCYNLSSPQTGNFTTASCSPTIQSSSLSVPCVTNTTMNLTFTRGNGARAIILARLGSAVNADPAYNTTYIADQNFGSGSEIGTGNYVVYDGNATGTITFSLTGLTAASTYYFKIYEYNTSPNCYNLVSPATISQTTNGGSYISSATTQNTAGTTAGALAQDVVKLTIVTGGDLKQAVFINSISFTTTGTTNINDLTNAKIFYTGNSNTFSNATQFGVTFTSFSGTLTATDNFALLTGNNYFWIAYDIKSTAAGGNVFDATIPSFNITTNGSTSNQSPAPPAPTGSRAIPGGTCPITTPRAAACAFSGCITACCQGITILSATLGNTLNSSAFPCNSASNGNGYNDNTSTATFTINEGSTYPMSINFDDWIGLDFRWAVWIDWNANGDFRDAGERFPSGTATNDIYTSTSITVPTNVATSGIKMRIWIQSDLYPNSCPYRTTCGVFSTSLGLISDVSISVPNATGVIPDAPGAVSCATLTPTVTTPVSYEQNASPSQLSATGTNLLWYTSPTGGTGSSTAPTPGTSTVGTTAYYVSQTNTSGSPICEGPRTQIAVKVNAACGPTPYPIIGGPYCGTGDVTLTNSETGVTYQLMDGANPVGASQNGNTGNILTFNPPVNNTASDITYTVQGTNAGGSTLMVGSVIVRPLPTIALGSDPSVCFSASSQTVNLTYSATTQSPNQYSMDWDAAANLAGLTDIVNASLPASPLALSIPAALAAGTYTGSLTVINTATGCVSIGESKTVTIEVAPPAPVVTTPVLYCQNASATALTATGNNLLWYTQATGGVGSGTAPTPVTTSPGTTDYYVSQTESCEGLRAAIAVKVYAPISTVTANLDNCAFTSLTGNDWEVVGSPAFPTTNTALFPSLTFDASGTPYMAFSDGANSDKATVMKYSNSSWVTVGAAGFSMDVAEGTSLAIDASGIPYVAFTDHSDNLKATVMKYNGSSWVNVGPPAFSAGEVVATKLVLDASGTPYVCYTDNANGDKATLMKFNGSNWVTVGSVGFTATPALQPSMAIDPSGNPYIVYVAGASTAGVMKFDGSNWTSVGTPNFPIGMTTRLSIAINSSGTPFVSFSDATNGFKANVVKYDGSAWVSVGSPNFSSSSAGDDMDLTLDASGNPYVAFQDGTYSGKATVMKYDGSNWITVGTAGFSPNAINAWTNVRIDPFGTPYVAYQVTAPNQTHVMRLNDFRNVVSVTFVGGTAPSYNFNALSAADQLLTSIGGLAGVFSASADGQTHQYEVSDGVCPSVTASVQTIDGRPKDIVFSAVTNSPVPGGGNGMEGAYTNITLGAANPVSPNGPALACHHTADFGDQWLTYITTPAIDVDNPNKAVVEINGHGQDLDLVTVSIFREKELPEISSSTNYGLTCYGYVQHALERHFIITSANSTQPNSFATPVGVRLYFSEAELKDLIYWTNLLAQQQGGCSWTDTVGSINSLYVTKYTGDNENGVYSDNIPSGLHRVYGPRTTSALGNGPIDAIDDEAGIFGRNLSEDRHYVEFSVTEFSELWLHGSQSGQPLPVDMLYLEAEAVNDAYIQVRWATVVETNNFGFDVERSTDGNTWAKIGFVQGHNNSTVQQTYRLDDHEVLANVRYYYRLKQVDFNGDFKYTDVVTAKINVAITFTVIDFMPNPTSGNAILNVRTAMDQAINIEIYNIVGQRVLLQNHQITKGSNNSIDFNLSALASGTYTAVVSSANEIYTKKLVITR